MKHSEKFTVHCPALTPHESETRVIHIPVKESDDGVTILTEEAFRLIELTKTEMRLDLLYQAVNKLAAALTAEQALRIDYIKLVQEKRERVQKRGAQ